MRLESNLINVIYAVKSVEEAKRRIYVDGVTFFSKNDVWQYIEISDQKLCPVCRANARRNGGNYEGAHLRASFPYLDILDVNTIQVNQHPNCLLAGTLVTTDKGLVPIEQIKLGDHVLTHKGKFKTVIQLHKNKYDGNLININDNWLTENHPVLTQRGWIPASLLNKSDSVFYIFTEPKQTPTVSNQTFFFPFILDNLTSTVMPVSPVNFDSNLSFGNSEINVENVNSVLWNNHNPSVLKRFKKLVLQTAKCIFSLDSLSTFHKKAVSFFSTPNTIVRRLNLTFSLLRRHLFPLQGFGFTLGSTFNSCTFQPNAYNVSTNTIMFGDSVFAPSFNCVEFNNFGNGQTSNPERLVNQSQSPITHIDNMTYKGFVYNLSVAEDESYCIGNNHMAVHNCRCVLVRLYRIKWSELND